MGKSRTEGRVLSPLGEKKKAPYLSYKLRKLSHQEGRETQREKNFSASMEGRD